MMRRKGSCASTNMPKKVRSIGRIFFLKTCKNVNRQVKFVSFTRNRQIMELKSFRNLKI